MNKNNTIMTLAVSLVMTLISLNVNAMTYNPEKQKQIVETFRTNYGSLADILKQNGIKGEDAKKFMDTSF